MALTPQEQREFKRLMIDLCLDDPKFVQQLVSGRHGWTRRVRWLRAGAAVCCFIALVVLSLTGAVGSALAIIATTLALTGIACGIGAAVPFPVPARARWLRIRLGTRRLLRRGRE